MMRINKNYISGQKELNDNMGFEVYPDGCFESRVIIQRDGKLVFILF